MEEYYRPKCTDDTMFDIKKFHGFVELQNRHIIDSLTAHGYNKHDFSQWMVDDRFTTLQDVRRLPDILNSKKASEVFFKSDSREAKKILAVEEITEDKLKDVPYDMLAKELSKRMINLGIHEVNHLKNDAEYSEKLKCLEQVYEDVRFILDSIE